MDLKLTTRRGIVSPRIAWRYYDLNDDRPTILFPGYSSAGDSYFRRGAQPSRWTTVTFPKVREPDTATIELRTAYRTGSEAA